MSEWSEWEKEEENEISSRGILIHYLKGCFPNSYLKDKKVHFDVKWFPWLGRECSPALGQGKVHAWMNLSSSVPSRNYIESRGCTKKKELIEHLISVAGVVALPCTSSACKGTACHSMTQAQRYLPTEWLILHGKYRPLFASAGSNNHPECPKSLLAPFHSSNLSLD